MPLNPAAAGSRSLYAGAKLTGSASCRSDWFLRANRLRGAKDYGINGFVTIEAITATKAQPC